MSDNMIVFGGVSYVITEATPLLTPGIRTLREVKVSALFEHWRLDVVQLESGTFPLGRLHGDLMNLLLLL